MLLIDTIGKTADSAETGGAKDGKRSKRQVRLSVRIVSGVPACRLVG
jgi:hypothetical protein